MMIRYCLLSVLLLLGVDGFLPHHQRASLSRPLSDSSEGALDVNDVGSDVVRSPLRFLGPYPSMPLRFPGLATASQKSRNVTGISLDFVLDTAANTNTINAQVASELELEKVGEAPGGVGAAGGLMGGDTFLLGDAELDLQRDSDDNKDEADDNFIFMQGLTASALPVAAPGAAGLLSLSFFYCFEGGVEFVWGDQTSLPSITFYGSDTNLNVNGMALVPFESLPVSMLPSVTISINGFEMPALFDTGSPITVLNAKAAEAAGIDKAIDLTEQADDAGSGWNPFSKIKANIQQAQELATATSRGDILTIMGSDGPVRLVKSKDPQTLSLQAQTFDAPASQKGDKQYTTVGQSHCYVGDLPGLAALGGLGDSAPPAAVLGMDFLRLRPRVVFRAQQKEIYM
mmetsp:Transcript_22837/g.34429  ORF Transcript_22837/g.34429 Transcript_22837/m.34429 type:complete len:400 (-) Transcript_22837:3515-4714(-)